MSESGYSAQMNILDSRARKVLNFTMGYGRLDVIIDFTMTTISARLALRKSRKSIRSQAATVKID